MQRTLFDDLRMTLGASIDLTIESLREYGARYGHWAIAFSGGKDSTALVTLVAHLIRSGRIEPPRRLTVCYADTRMELPPLAASASQLLSRLRADGFETQIAVAPLDQRYFVYMLGRGVPPPNNGTLRWCTEQIKVEPMEAALEAIRDGDEQLLMLTGVRLGESAARDSRIALACSRNGSECGQGWYQEKLPTSLCATLSPLLHWRTCLVWDWLSGLLPDELRHGYPTDLVAEAYGLDEEGSASEIAARTGCVGCPLANHDGAITRLLAIDPDRWRYLEPLLELRPLYRWLREPGQRLRQPAGERRKDGSLVQNQCRMGPLTMAAHRHALARVVDIQSRCNALAASCQAAPVDMLDAEEHARILELIAANTWPRKWTGDEPTGNEPYRDVSATGELQNLLPIL